MNEPSPEVFHGVVNLLRTTEYDFRTVDSIAKELDLSTGQVKSVVYNYPYYVRKCPIKSNNGDVIYTSADRPIKLREILACIQTFVSKDYGRLN